MVIGAVAKTPRFPRQLMYVLHLHSAREDLARTPEAAFRAGARPQHALIPLAARNGAAWRRVTPWLVLILFLLWCCETHTLRSSTASLLNLQSSILTFGLLPRFPCRGSRFGGDEEIVGSFITEVAGLQKLRGFTSLHRKAILPTIASTPTFHDYVW